MSENINLQGLTVTSEVCGAQLNRSQEILLQGKPIYIFCFSSNDQKTTKLQISVKRKSLLWKVLNYLKKCFTNFRKQ